VCLSSDFGQVCDCSWTGFSGSLCEKGYETQIFLNGKGGIFMEFAGCSLLAGTQNISFEFKTSNANGNLLVLGHNDDYIALSMHDGKLQLSAKLKPAKIETIIC